MNTRLISLFGIAFGLTLSLSVMADDNNNLRQTVNGLVTTTQQLTVQVNNNSAAIAGLSPAQSYDFHDYAWPTSLTAKTFRNHNIVALNDAVYTETISRTIGTTGTNETITRTFLPGNSIQFDYISTADAFSFVAQRNYNPGDPNPISSNVLVSPIPDRTATMKVGSSFGSSSEVVVNGGAGEAVIQIVNTLLAAESVTLHSLNGSPVTLNDCIKINSNRSNTASFFGGSAIHTIWYCKGYGQVKRLHSNGDMIELIATQ